jgi:hypothetical protein
VNKYDVKVVVSDEICHHPRLRVCGYAIDVNCGNAYYVRFLLEGVVVS